MFYYVYLFDYGGVHIGSLCEINKQESDMQSDYYVDVFDRT